MDSYGHNISTICQIIFSTFHDKDRWNAEEIPVFNSVFAHVLTCGVGNPCLCQSNSELREALEPEKELHESDCGLNHVFFDGFQETVPPHFGGINGRLGD